jgi:hypothetical protein
MKKIKLNLVSGASIEKPLINAFKANNNSYVILDNEMNGSMGLPIILVSKVENEKLIKILDQGEWQSVKELLKNIIAGGSVENIKLNDSMSADDIYYTQLTLPVASFDALKAAYKEDETGTGEAPSNNEVGVMDINPSEVTAAPAAPDASPAAPVAPEPTPEVVAPTPEPIPVVEPTPAPVAPEVAPTPAEPEITPTPIIETNISTDTSVNDRFKDQKEAFMQACENMFDALVQKFEKELENK